MTARRTLLALAAAVLAAAGFAAHARADAVEIDPDTYAAVAYSPSTGKYGYAWKHWSKGAAERAALSECDAKDAKVIGWVQYGWLALAVGDDGSYEAVAVWGDGATDADAKKQATKAVLKRGAKKVTTLVVVCSGDVDPVVLEKK